MASALAADDEEQPRSSLRQLVDADLVPSGTTLVIGGAADSRVAHVLPDGRLYADGETYDSLIDLSEAVGVSGNPWSTWAAELADGRVLLSVLRVAYADTDMEATTSHSQPRHPDCPVPEGMHAGQHGIVLNVLNNCGRRCVFCGLNPAPFGAKKMLLAGHIKPWKDSSATERLDPRNGLAACPSHDVAFDTGMLTVTADLNIHIARPLADAARSDHLTRQYYGRPPLLDTLLIPDEAEHPRRRFLDWHREKIFVA